MTPFSLQTNPVLHFGSGSRFKLPQMLPPDGPSLILLSRTFSRTGLCRDLLEKISPEPFTETIHGEPSPETVDTIVNRYRSRTPSAVAAIGGGSVLDAGKAVAAMLCENAPVQEFLEGVGTRTPSGRTLPFYALPTTAGTGSEATKNAVLSRPGPEGFKKSLRHDNYVPYAALVDPDLTQDLPFSARVAGAFDALSQLIESLLSRKLSPPVEALGFSGLSTLSLALSHLTPGTTRSAPLSYAAYLSGVCLANAGLGAVHGIAGPLGGYCTIPHGVACGLLLAPVMKATFTGDFRIPAEQEQRVRRIAAIVTGSENADAQQLVAQLETWAKDFPLPPLSSYGLTKDDCGVIAGKCGNKDHPVSFSREQFRQILVSLLR